MKILLSAGHGGTDSGSLGSDRQKEKNRTIDLANRVAKYLKSAGHSVTIKQEKNFLGKWSMSNRNGYDYALSIHFNAFNGSATGTEVLYKNTVKKATIMANNVAKAMEINNRGAKNRTDLYMLNIGFDNLVEVCFHDNSKDLSKYNANIEKVAKAIAESIVGNVTATTTTVKNPNANDKPTNTGDITYKVRDGVKKQYLPPVVNDDDYAGNKGHFIDGIKAKCKNGNIYIQSHVIGKPTNKWEDVVTLNALNYNSNSSNAYSGAYGKPIDCIKIWSDYGYVTYRVSPVKGNYYDWVDSRNRNSGKSNAYAGVYGKAIDRIQMR